MQRVIGLLLFGLLGISHAWGVTVDPNLNKYKVYQADLNGDNKLDYYFHGVPLFILLHGDIATPIALPAPQSFVIYSQGNGFLLPMQESYTDAQMALRNLVLSTANQNALQAIIASATIDPNDPNNQGGITNPVNPQIPSTPNPVTSIDTTRALPAEFDVTSSGQATYKVPVLTAPGSAGLVPNVSLNYSSGGGNGIMGLGWSLSAYGAISRCRQTEGVDKVAKAITWSSGDRFCLNGERLLLASGTYGVAGSSYKTEIDSFARITAVGGTAGHPNYFTVEYKDGIIETYGNTTDSINAKNQLSASNNNTVLDWALSKRQDSAGNKIIFNYTKDANGQRIDTIDYAFGTTSTRGAYLQFNYESRNDPISGYVAGHAYKTGSRLLSVKSYNGTDEIRSYYITYNQGSASTTNDKLSRINKIQDCVGTVCSPATEFEWELPDYQLAAATSTKSFPNGISVHAIGDFNGDGLQDIAWLDQAVGGTYSAAGLLLNRPLRYAYGKIDIDGKFIFENQQFSNGSWTGPHLNSRTLRAMDLNNDGRMDLAFDVEQRQGYDVRGSASSLLSVPMPDGTWKLSVSSVGQQASYPYGLPLAKSEYSEVGIDVNGDGLLDGIGWPMGELPWDGEFSGGYVAIAKNNFAQETRGLTHVLGDPGFKDAVEWDYQHEGDFRANIDSAPINYLTQLSGDFNGDGAMDVTSYSFVMFQGCHVQDEGYRFCSGNLMVSWSAMYTMHKTSSGDYELRYFPSSVPSLWDNWDLFVDANNDGLTDLLARDMVGGWGLRINTGNGLGQPSAVGISYNVLKTDANTGNNELVLADINGDGYQDIVWQKPLNASALIGSSEIKVKYWDPQLNQFESQERLLGTLPYKIIQNYNNVPVGTQRPDPRMINILRFKTDRFNMMDVNGDGIPDLITTPNTQTNDSVVTVRLGTNTKQNGNKIVAITNGLGEKKKISYARINEPDHYSRLSGINSSSTTRERCEDVIQTHSDDTQYVEHLCWTETVSSVDSTQFYKDIHDPWHHLLPEEQSLRPSTPVLEPFGPMSVVTGVEVTAPSANAASPNTIDTTATAKLSYYYGHAKMQAGGRGFLGFRYFSVVNRETGVRTETEYRQDWPYIGKARKITTFTASGSKISEQENTWGFVNCHNSSGAPNASCVSNMSTQVDASGTGALGAVQPFLRKSSTKTYEAIQPGNNLISTSIENTVYDSAGNILRSESSISSPSLALPTISKTTVNVYTYSGSTWSMQKGRLQRMAVTADEPTYGAITRVSSFTYHQSGAAIGLLNTETIEPDNSSFTVTTTHSYDQGNRYKSVTAADGQIRQSEVAYDARGRYVDKTYGFLTNGTAPDTPVRQLVSQVMSRDKYGTPTDVRNYVSSNNYVTKKVATTTFGVPYFTSDSTGAFANIKIGTGADAYNLCPSDNKIWTITTAAGGAISIDCKDILGRVRRAGTIGFDGVKWSLVDTEYDKLGRVVRTSAPYWHTTDERHWTSQRYDLLGRVTETISPYKDNTYVTTEHAYANLQVSTKNPKSQVRIERRDLAGQVYEVVDPNNGVTKFKYDARGNMREMHDPASNSTKVGYDLRDRKISMSDPDKGSWVYKYNRFGDLVCQMDGKGQTSVQRYDIAGRMFSRTDRLAGGNCDAPNGTVEKYSQWTYDNAANGWGQLAAVHDSASVGGAAQYQQTYSYDSFGRVTGTTTTMPGHGGVVGSHYEKVTYDQYGRVFQAFDAARTSATFTNNGIQNVYNAYGYLNKVIDAISRNGYQQAHYTVNNMDARGNVTSAEYGNGVTQNAAYYSETGLTKILQASRAIGSLPIQDIELDWDEVGNVSWRHEKGTANSSGARNIRESFGYDSLNRLNTWTTSGDLNASESVNYNHIDNITSKTGIGNYLYGTQCGAGTNAGPHALCRAGATNYFYDKNGNMLNDSAGRTMKYTTYDLPSEITKSGHKTEFSYGPDRARYKRVDTASGQATTTLYLGSVEKVYYWDGSIQWKRNIAGVGLITQTVNSSGIKLGEAQRYFIKDHLGSIGLITDEIGYAEQTNYFDPWGRERKIVTSGSIKQWLANNDNYRIASKPITTRGFTGHEQLAEVGLIHMNGRIYDGALGRFVQADPIIQDPLRVQSLNRYSYVWNNPLNATDPSGFCTKATVDKDTTMPCAEDTQPKEQIEEVVVKGNKDDRPNNKPPSGMIATLIKANISGQSFSNYVFRGQGFQVAVDSHIVEKHTGGDIKNLTKEKFAKILMEGAATKNSLAIATDAAIEASGDVGGFENLEGNPFLGAAAIAVNQATMGIVFGNTSVLSLRATPQIEANMAAAKEGNAGKLIEAASVVAMVWGGGAIKKAPEVLKDFNQARNEALEWLLERGFKAEIPTIGKFGSNRGKPIGMKTADGNIGFRVEFDARSGAHINIWAGKEKGPHIPFAGDQLLVNKLVKQFEK